MVSRYVVHNKFVNLKDIIWQNDKNSYVPHFTGKEYLTNCFELAGIRTLDWFSVA